MTTRLPTGVDPLDRALDGGLSAGSLVAILAPPKAQSEPLLRAGMSVRPTVYVSTIRAEQDVRETLERTTSGADYRIESVGVEDPLGRARDATEDLDEQSNVVVDAMNPLESQTDEPDYVSFLNTLREHLRETGSVAFLHCLEADPSPRHRELTLAAADLVWDLDLVPETSTIEFYLEMPRVRGRSPSDRVLNLHLGEDIRVDTSRDIA